MPTPIFVSGVAVTGGWASANILNSQNTYHFHTSSSVQWSFAAEQVSFLYKIHAYKSVDNGSTWMEQDAGNGPENNGVGPGVFWDGADTVYIGVIDTTPVAKLFSFDLTTGLFGSQIGPSSGTLPSTTISTAFSYVLQFSDASFRFFYITPVLGNPAVIKLQDFDGATWSNETTVATDASGIQVKEIVLQADVQHLIYKDTVGFKYIRIARNGSTSAGHSFSGGDGIQLFGGSVADGIYEADNDEIVFPALVSSGGLKVVVYRGTPTASPVWTQEIAYPANSDIPDFPTLVRLADGTEQLFFTYYPVTPNQDDGFNFLSAIATVTNDGSGWSALSQYYNLAIDPFSDPDPDNCTGDEILNLGAEVYGGQVYLQFDGFSVNFSAALLRQPNFGFAATGPPPTPPTCSLSGSPTGISPGGSATLTWTTTNTPTTASIDNGVGNVNPNGGSIVVSPTVTTTYILTVTNADGSSTCQVTISVGVLGPSCGGAPSGRVGVAYSATFTSTGGTAPYTFAIGSGSLPFGLTLASDGTVSGVPTQAGVFFFTISVTDANGVTGSVACNIPIAC